MLDSQDTIDSIDAPARPGLDGYTPTLDRLPRRVADFATLGEALDYAATGVRGMNFHDARGTLVRAYPYSELRHEALDHARRFVAMGLVKGDRLALVAETGPEFAACFFGAIYAGLWPVPLPLPTSFGGRDAYVEQLEVMLTSSDPQLFLFPPELTEYATAAADQRGITARDWDSLAAIAPTAVDLPHSDGDDIGYLQYSSGSTRFPHGVAVTHRALLDNLRAHAVGLTIGGTAAAFRGCPGIMTWDWSAASCRSSPTRCRSII